MTPEFSRLESNILDSDCTLSSKIEVMLHVSNLPGHSTSFHSVRATRKEFTTKFIFQIDTLYLHGVNERFSFI